MIDYIIVFCVVGFFGVAIAINYDALNAFIKEFL